MHLAWLWPDTTSKTIKDIKTWCLLNSVIGLTNLLERSFTWTRNSQQNVCTKKGKYLIRLPKRNNIIVIGSNLCSKDIIQYDSFAFIFLIFFFVIILYFYYCTILDCQLWLTQKESVYWFFQTILLFVQKDIQNVRSADLLIKEKEELN